MPKLKAAIQQISAKTGLSLGIALILVTLGAYFIDWDIIMSAWFQSLKLVLLVIFAIYATLQSKKLSPEAFSFREAFSAFFITVALGTAMYTLLNYVLFDLIDKDAGHYLTQMSVEKYKDTARTAGQNNENIKQSIEQLKTSDQFSALNQLKGYVFNLALYSLLGVVVAFIFKKKKTIVN